MNTVTIRYFAVFREVTGLESETLETGAATLQELFDEMTRRHRDLRTESAALVAVNDVMSSWERPVRNGDEILFFPPVAGG